MIKQFSAGGLEFRLELGKEGDSIDHEKSFLTAEEIREILDNSDPAVSEEGRRTLKIVLDILDSPLGRVN